MNDRDLQVLEQYPFTVRGSFRVRGAFLLDTSEGRRLIREYSGSVQKLETEQKLLLHLQEQGYLVDRMEPDQEGKLASVWREYNSYVVKEALEGRECDTRSAERDHEGGISPGKPSSVHAELYGTVRGGIRPDDRIGCGR